MMEMGILSWPADFPDRKALEISDSSLDQKISIDKSDQRENYGGRQTSEFLWLDEVQN